MEQPHNLPESSPYTSNANLDKPEVFEKGKSRREDMERAFIKLKRGFNLDELGVTLP